MYKNFGHCNVTSPKNNTCFWRRAELSDLPRLKTMIYYGIGCQVFAGFSDDIARLITENPMSLCQVRSNNVISMFVSLCDRPNIACVAYEQWTEWFNHLYDLADVEEYNTLFVHALLFQCVESLVDSPAMFETIYVQMPEICNVILIKIPGMDLAAEICSSFTSLPAKNVIEDPKYGRPEILYHTRPSSINEVRLRTAITDDFIGLRANLGDRLDFLDAFYGEHSLAKILKIPGDGRFNLVSVTAAAEVNGLITVKTTVNYSMLDSVFDLHEYEGLAVSQDRKTELNETTPLPSDRETMENLNTPLGSRISTEDVKNSGLMVSYPYKRLIDRMDSATPFIHSNCVQDDSVLSIFSNAESRSTTMHVNENDPDDQLFLNISRNILTNFLKFQDEPTNSFISSSHSILDEQIENANMNYKKTSFMIELMLIIEKDENKASREFLMAYFRELPQYDYCLVTLSTIVIPPEFKKIFCKVFLKPNRYYIGQLYVLHRLSLFGIFTCSVVTKENLKIVIDLIKNHPFEQVISNNISKSIFEDTSYKTYIFQCNDRPIGYCVIRLSDEITFLSRHFDVACYVYPELARNHAAVLLNMDIETIFLKKARCLLKCIMNDNDVNCLFYKLYSDSTVMEQNESSYISGIDELIPVKPRVRIRYDNDDLSGDDYEKFALFHLNMRLCTTQKLSLDVKIVVVGASTVALSFLESLLFNPVNHYVSFENIVLVSDNGLPYRVCLTDMEDRLVPKDTHYNHEYMKTIALNSFVDVVTGTVTAIDRYKKYVKINVDGSTIFYDYLFMFIGEQFTHSIENIETKPEKLKKNHASRNSFTSHKSNDENVSLKNFFLLNSDRDIVYACNYIEKMKSKYDKAIIVYGKYLGSLSVINVLLESNIDGCRIVYVESGDRGNLPFIESVVIKRAVYDELFQRGVTVYEGLQFKSLTLNGDQTKIRQVSFSSAVKSFTVDCAGLFWFDQKSIVKNNLAMLCAFKFDGQHLAVNESFETSVEWVRAAGPVTGFRGPKGGARPSSSSDVGARVADLLMKRLGVRDMDGANAARPWRPVSVYCRLPGRHRYLHCAVSGDPTRYADTLRTGNAETGYFEMTTDKNGYVMKLSCYTRKDFKYTNLINLCGKHVDLFNDLKNRLLTNSVPCLFNYFNEPWAYPLYSDRFPKLLDDVSKLQSADTKDQVCDFSALRGLDAGGLEKVLINFIAENVDDFPQFAHVRDAVDRIQSAQYH